MTTHSAKTAPPVWRRFSLQALFVLTMIVAAFLAGWIAHREWNKQNVENVIQNAAQRLDSAATVEINENTGVMILRGSKEEVEALESNIQEVEEAAKK